MRRGFGLIGLVLTGILIAIVGVLSYDAGWSAGAATHVADGAAAVPYYAYAPHFFGFGLFGFLFFLVLLFVLFRIAGFAMGWGRGGWGYGGRGYGSFGSKRGGFGGGVPPAIEERMQEWHKRAHGEQTAAPTPPPPPGPDQTPA
jgi:hypothetical protein